jgi:putative hemolysin
MSQMQYAAVFIVLLVGAAVYVVMRSRMNKRQPERPGKGAASNVISMEGHRKAKQSSVDQPCSSCKKKNGKLIFYAQDDGSVVGLCKDCKGKAKKRDMLPL